MLRKVDKNKMYKRKMIERAKEWNPNVSSENAKFKDMNSNKNPGNKALSYGTVQRKKGGRKRMEMKNKKREWRREKEKDGCVKKEQQQSFE